MTTHTLQYYPKIHSPYLRQPHGQRALILTQPAIPETADPDQIWSWSWKWDGTSVGVMGGTPFGRTANSALTWDHWQEVLEAAYHPMHKRTAQALYGALVGPGLNGNRHELAVPEVRWFEEWYLHEDGWKAYPHQGLWETQQTLGHIVNLARYRLLDQWIRDFAWHPYTPEGLVGRLYRADGSISARTKIKTSDQFTDIPNTVTQSNPNLNGRTLEVHTPLAARCRA